MNFCPRCDHKIKEKHNYCSRCGQSLKENNKTAKEYTLIEGQFGTTQRVEKGSAADRPPGM